MAKGPAIRIQASDRDAIAMYDRLGRKMRDTDAIGMRSFDNLTRKSELFRRGMLAISLAAASAGAALVRAAKEGVSEWKNLEIVMVRTQNLVSNMDAKARGRLTNYVRDIAVETGARQGSVAQSSFTAMSGGARDQVLKEVMLLAAQSEIAYGMNASLTAGRIMQGAKQTGLSPGGWYDAAITGADIGQTDITKLSKEAAKTTTGAKMLGIDQRENLGLLGFSTLYTGSTPEAATQLKALYGQATKEDSPFAKEFKKTTGVAFMEAVQQDGFINALERAFDAIGPTLAASRLGLEAGPLAYNLVNEASGARSAMTSARLSGGAFTEDYGRASDTFYGQSRRTGAAALNFSTEFGETISPVLKEVMRMAEEILSDPTTLDAMEGLALAIGNFIGPASELAAAFATISAPISALAGAQVPTPGGGVPGLDVGGTVMGMFALTELQQMMKGRGERRTARTAPTSRKGMGSKNPNRMKIQVKDMRKIATRGGAQYFVDPKTGTRVHQKGTAMVNTYGGPMVTQPPMVSPWYQRVNAKDNVRRGGRSAMNMIGMAGRGAMSLGMYGMGAAMVSGLVGQITGFDPMQKATDGLTEAFKHLTDATYAAEKAALKRQEADDKIRRDIATELSGENIPENIGDFARDYVSTWLMDRAITDEMEGRTEGWDPLTRQSLPSGSNYSPIELVQLALSQLEAKEAGNMPDSYTRDFFDMDKAFAALDETPGSWLGSTTGNMKTFRESMIALHDYQSRAARDPNDKVVAARAKQTREQILSDYPEMTSKQLDDLVAMWKSYEALTSSEEWEGMSGKEGFAELLATNVPLLIDVIANGDQEVAAILRENLGVTQQIADNTSRGNTSIYQTTGYIMSETSREDPY